MARWVRGEGVLVHTVVFHAGQTTVDLQRAVPCLCLSDGRMGRSMNIFVACKKATRGSSETTISSKHSFVCLTYKSKRPQMAN